jgi:hypothetical protein
MKEEIRKILRETEEEQKPEIKQSDVLYSCVLLDKASHNALLNRVEVPEGWTVYAHHMTINLGPLKDKSELGKKVDLFVTKVGISDMAMAVQVDGYPSKNAIPHVTIAVNQDGGKPVMSNDITKWKNVKIFVVSGVVTEIKKNG